MIALSVAATLAVFLLYTVAAGATPSVQPGQLHARTGTVELVGRVVGPVRGDTRASGLRFRVHDISGRGSVLVVYRGAVPDLFRTGRHILVQGRMRDGVFVGDRDTLVTRCPSKYAPSR